MLTRVLECSRERRPQAGQLIFITPPSKIVVGCFHWAKITAIGSTKCSNLCARESEGIRVSFSISHIHYVRDVSIREQYIVQLC
jgi:hypothetical protein